jgi:hypothetical protein
MSALEISLQFLIQLLSLLGVDMLGCVTFEGTHLYPAGFGGIKTP